MKVRLTIFALLLSVFATEAQQQAHVVVSPLLETTWNQWTPYNNLCPKNDPTGCVVTAVAQIMNYWQWPENGFGTHTHEGLGVTVDFSKSTYKWADMKNDYAQDYTDEQANAIAQLMYDLGIGYDAKYSTTGTSIGFGVRLLSDHFGYDPAWTSVSGVSESELATFIKDELDAGRPVLYCGYHTNQTDEQSGHALVCDGYTSDGYFHFNYGWGGLHDGWYQLGDLYEYNYNVSVWGNLQPSGGSLITVGDFTYCLFPNGEADVRDCSLTSGDITIPATVTVGEKTYRITNVHLHGTLANKSFQTVTIGNNVRRISAQSFVATRIETLVIGDAVEEIGAGAFASAGIKNLTIGQSVRYIGDKAFMANTLSAVTCYSKSLEVGDFAFQSTNIKDGEWLGCITRMGEQAFANTKLESPNFANVIEIGSRALAGNSLSSINFPATLKSISTDAFWGSVLYYIKIDKNNPWYCTDDTSTNTMILNRQKTRLVMAIPTAMYNYSYTVPSTVIHINKNAFPREAKSVKIPASVVEMEGAFARCEKLKTVYCYSTEPIVITNETFMPVIFEQDATLYVPTNCDSAYSQATGWKQFTKIYPELEAVPSEVPTSVYRMTAHCNNGTAQSFAVSEIDKVTIGNDNKLTVEGVQEWEKQISDIDSITWRKDFIYEDGEIFLLDDSTLTAEALYCKVILDPTIIDKETTLSIRTSLTSPTKIDGAVQGEIFDICLGNGLHELTGTAHIRVPMQLSENELACAAWYNHELEEWVPVNGWYDHTTGELVISTNHFSTFGAFTIDKRYTRAAKLTAYYLPESNTPLSEVVNNLRTIVTSPDPLTAAADFYVNDLNTALQLGNDFTYNALKGFGFESEFLNKFSERLSYFGMALGAYQVARAAYQGNDEQVAGGTLKLMLGSATNALNNALSSKVMSASMASVAFIDYAINRFAEEAWSGRKDLYKAAFNYYYSKAGRAAVNPTEGRGFRTATDWYKVLYPVCSRTNLTEEGMKTVIDSIVTDYCWEYWYDTDAQTICTTEATNMGYTYSGGLNESIRRELSNELRASLYNGTLVSVFQCIKNHKENELYEEASKSLDEYCKLMNRIVTIHISDSGAKGKSEYFGYTMQFGGINEKVTDPELWQCTLDSVGSGYIQYRVFAFTDASLAPELILVSPDDEELARYPFTMDFNGNKMVAEIDLAGGGIEIPAEDAWSFDLNPAYALDDEEKPAHLLTMEDVHLWDGIKEALADNRQMSPDKGGAFNISAEGVTIEGTVDTQTHTGSGTFSINATTAYNNPFTEAEIFDRWWNVFTKGEINTDQCWLKQYTATHDIQGTFTVGYSNKAQRYVIHLQGTGTCSMSGQKYTSGDNSVLVYDNKTGTWSFTDRIMDTEAVHLNNAQETMDCV